MATRIPFLGRFIITAVLLFILGIMGVAMAHGAAAADPTSSIGSQVLGTSRASSMVILLDQSSDTELIIDPMESRLFDLLNGERIARGLSALSLDSKLEALARLRSSDMASRGYFDHVTPEGNMVFDLMNQQGIPYKLAGENLARNGASPQDSPQVAHQGFMNSPAHAENDLDPTFNRVGIGVATSVDGTIYFTELFAELD